MRKVRALPFGLLLFTCAACSPAAVSTLGPAQPEQFDGERALQAVADQMALGARIPGTDGHRLAGEYILARLEAAGWVTGEQTFDGPGGPFRNLIGLRRAEGGPLIILGAHYDTRAVAERDPTDPSAPVPGANDGASGVAVLLELARVLPGGPPGLEIRLVFFDAEDGGGAAGGEWILGSRHFATTLSETPAAVVVVDMVGDADLQLYYETGSDRALAEAIWRTASELGHTGFVPEPRHALLDDHTPFLEMGIPAVDIIDFDYPYWHTTGDTLDKIAAESLEQVGRTLQAWLVEVSQTGWPPAE